MRFGLLALLLLNGCGVRLFFPDPDVEYETGPDVFSEPVAHIGDDWLFSSARINRIDVEIGEASMEILRAERIASYPRNSVRASAVIDGEDVGEIGVRLRGGIGSFSTIDRKPKLELDLNDYSGERFYGLESLSLNNMRSDCSGIRETIVYAAYGLAGLATSRTGYAQLFVNGHDYGLMLVLETQDDRWLAQNFADGDGNFYDGKYVFAGMWPILVDFGLGRDHWFDLEEGDGADFADIEQISEGVLRAEASGRIDVELQSLVDWEQVMTALRVEEWTGNGDGYASGPNNYRVYFEPDQPLVLTPWDVDGSLQTEGFFGGDGNDTGGGVGQVRINTSRYENPAGALGRVCLDDPGCLAIWEEMGPLVEEQLMDGTLYDLAVEASDLIRKGRIKDPRTECTAKDFDSETAVLLDYLETGEFIDTSGLDDDEDQADCNQTGSRPPRGVLWLSLVLLGLVRRRSR